jgi:hypothetical protein
MMKRTVVFFFIALLLPTITSCHSGEKSTPREISSNNNHESCEIEDILRQVDSLLKDHTYETHCLNMYNQFVLSFWMVHPELDTDASENEVYANTEKAFGRGIKTAYSLLSRIPCIKDVFDSINPMIVDQHYSLWYRDIIPIRVLTIMAKYDDEQRMKIFMGRQRGLSYFRTTPVHPRIKVDMSMWPRVHNSLRRILNEGTGKKIMTIFPIFVKRRPNVAAYPILLDEYSSVQVYFSAENEEAGGDESAYEKIESLVELFSASSLPVQVTQVGFVENDGMLKSYCNISGSIIRKYKRNGDLDLKKIIRIHDIKNSSIRE